MDIYEMSLMQKSNLINASSDRTSELDKIILTCIEMYESRIVRCMRGDSFISVLDMENSEFDIDREDDSYEQIMGKHKTNYLIRTAQKLNLTYEIDEDPEMEFQLFLQIIEYSPPGPMLLILPLTYNILIDNWIKDNYTILTDRDIIIIRTFHDPHDMPHQEGSIHLLVNSDLLSYDRVEGIFTKLELEKYAHYKCKGYSAILAKYPNIQYSEVMYG